VSSDDITVAYAIREQTAVLVIQARIAAMAAANAAVGEGPRYDPNDFYYQIEVLDTIRRGLG
jgi:hypothetical protein